MDPLKNIYLIGFMCAGKTLTGRELAARLRRPFADCDAAVERAAGRSVAAIVGKHGLGAFRRLEAAAVKKLCARRGTVIALGGGVYPSRRWRGLLARTGFTVFLDCGWRELERRLKAGRKGRPLLEGSEAAALRGARRLLEKRLKYYEAADMALDVTGLTPGQAAQVAAERLK